MEDKEYWKQLSEKEKVVLKAINGLKVYEAKRLLNAVIEKLECTTIQDLTV